jgi:ATP-dependent Clp protease ATP-binding subunit ClpA
MIGRKAEAVLNLAVRYAVDREHEYFTLEHVLWALLGEELVIDTLKACDANLEEIKRDLEAYLDVEVPKMHFESSASSELETDESAGNAHPVATLSIQRLIQRALFQVQSSGKDEIQPIDLFVALFQAKESFALQLLNEQGVERLDVLHFVSHGMKRDEDEGSPDESGEDESSEAGTAPNKKDNARKKAGDDPLENYTLNLNQQARLGKVDPLVGRQVELDRMIQVLCRRRKNNPILVGEAGVGKTAIAEGLALRIVEGAVPELLEDAVVYSLDLGSLLAGAKFRGDFEQRLKSVLQALERKAEHGSHPILMIDEIHTIIGAGAVSGGALDAANLLKPLLTRGELRVIGSTTYQEFRNIFEKDHALARRFQKIDVAEPSVEETVQILNGLKSRFEDHHDVEFTPDAIRAAAELAAKHLTDRFLPDKAIDVIDEAGAKARLARTPTPKSGASAATVDPEAPAPKRRKIEREFVEEIIAQIARIPARSINVSQKERLRNLERDLKLTIYGQDHAVDALVTSIRLARSGLRTGERPVGSFLFCGPTGVGKTELSRQLGLCMGVPFLRFDMSEYSEKHTVSRLIGAPPGYVGFEQAGLLTDAVTKNPYSVILLDEIEKAHSDIWNILLQIMDHGTLTDNNGRKADFRNVILIMTSNVGSREMERRPLGMVTSEANSKNSGALKAVEQTFTPEFRNRLDSIVYFNPLDPVTVGQVVGKQILELESQLLAKKVEVEVGLEVRDWLAQKGYDRTMGARPLARLIQDQIKKPLAEEILFGKLENGGRVEVLVRNGELAFEFKKASVPKRESETVSKGTRRG